MKKLLLILIGMLLVTVSCKESKSPLLQQMEETAKRNEEIKAKMEEEKKAKPKIDLEELKVEMPPLVESASKGDLAKVKSILKEGTLVDTKDSRQRTALYVAASEGKKEVAEHLLSQQANINTKRDDGDTPLMAAARSGNVEMVNLLVEKGADVNGGDNFGRTVLMMAAQGGKKEIVDYLIEKGADINKTDKFEISPLIFAMRYDHMDLAKHLLDKGAKVWAAKPVPYSKKPITLKIEDKVQPGMQEVIEELAKKEVKLRQKTELFYAVETGDLELVKLLVKKGAPVLVQDVEQSVENIIYVYGKKEEMRQMLFEREAIRTSYDRDQKNLLHYAAEGGYLEIMKFLIDKGARLEETDGENVRGPLFYTVNQNVEHIDDAKHKRLGETAAYIIEEGKKTWTKRVRLSKKELDKMRKEQQSRPWWEQNPFDVEYKDVVSPKVNIEEYDYEGWTVLTLAAKNGLYEVVKVLVDAGVIVNHKERKFGNTALIYSRVGKFEKIEKLLLENCAKEGIDFDHEELAKKGWKCVDGKEVFENK
jgi:uncharacterized protein